MATQALTTDEKIRQYAESNGFLEVWRSWRDHMLAQGRDVPEIRMDAETLPQNDIELDTEIAYDVVRDFVSWLDCQICNPTALSAAASALGVGTREAKLAKACEALLEYRRLNTLNRQLEKADDFFRLIRLALEEESCKQ